MRAARADVFIGVLLSWILAEAMSLFYPLPGGKNEHAKKNGAGEKRGAIPGRGKSACFAPEAPSLPPLRGAPKTCIKNQRPRGPREAMRKILSGAVLAAIVLLLFQPGCAPADPKIALLNRLKSASKLATVKFTFNKIIWGEKEKRIFIKLKNASFLATSKVDITAGIDLAKIRGDDLDLSRQSVRLKLPPVEIIAYSYPFEKIQVDRNYTANRFLNPIRLEDMEEFLRLADADVRKSLDGLGLRRKAEDNTRALLTRFLKKFGFASIDLEFSPGGPLAFTAYE